MTDRDIDMDGVDATYRGIVRHFCERMHLPEVDQVARGGLIEVDGVNLSITWNAVVPEAPAVSIWVDVGMPPRDGEAMVLRVLLQQNFANAASRGLAYCISPASGRIVGVIHVGLAGLEGQGLEALVNMLVDVTLEFRRTCFLWRPAVDVDSGIGGSHDLGMTA